jgi:Tol biopolymer transport system component
MYSFFYRSKVRLILVFVIVLNFDAQPQSLNIENIHELFSDSIKFTKPVWGSDGNSLLLMGESNRGLYTYDIKTQNLNCIANDIKIKSKPVWLKTGEIIYLKGNNYERVNRFKSAGSPSTDTILTIDTKCHKINAVSLSDNKTWEITPEKAFYYNPLISPNQKFAIVHLKSEMYLYATDGSGLIKHLGTGLAGCWSSDSKFIFCFIDESYDGHNTTNSDIFVLEIDSIKIQKLTTSTEMFEMWPAVSPDGSKMVFKDEKTGKIFISDLKITGE